MEAVPEKLGIETHGREHGKHDDSGKRKRAGAEREAVATIVVERAALVGRRALSRGNALPARTRTVIDRERLAEHPLQIASDDARHDIGRPTSGKRHHGAHRAKWRAR